MKKSDGLVWGLVDLLTALLIVFMAMAALALTAAKPVKMPGQVIVQLWWDIKVDADVDLWTKAPGATPIGYSNQDGIFCNLLRDDLGRSEDSQSRNYEITVCRGAPDGEYVVNAMEFSSHDHVFPIRVWMTVTVGGTQIIRESGELDYEGEELTLARFRLLHNHLVPGSVNRLPMALRSAQ